MSNPLAKRRARSRRARVAGLALLLLSVVPAQAVVNATGDGMGTITPPADDPGFSHVGVTGNGLSGIYIGNRWMLTAAHVGEQSLTLGGVTYPAVPGSLIQLHHLPGAWSDVVLVRLASEPPLAPLVLASTPMTLASNVTMIGHAWDREPNQVCWNASYAKISCSPFAAFRGFERAAAPTFRKRWGRNAVAAIDQDVTWSGLVTSAFRVDFEQAGVTYEAQAVPGDSGGAAFLKRGGQWELVGVMVAISIYTGQPHYTTTMFGNATYIADVAWYRPQIEEIVNAPQIPMLSAPLYALCAAALAGVARAAFSRRARNA